MIVTRTIVLKATNTGINLSIVPLNGQVWSGRSWRGMRSTLLVLAANPLKLAILDFKGNVSRV